MTARRVGLLVAIVLGAGAGAACAPRVARVVSEGGSPAGAPGDYAPAIRSEATWRLLAARPGTEHMARSEVVKVIVDRSDGEVYFMESKRWPIHFFFAARFLNKPGRPVEDQVTFNRRQYKAEDRRFVLGTVPVSLARDLAAATMTLSLNGEVRSTGSGAACLGNPLFAARWLADTMSRLGTPLRAGDVVLTGALGKMVDVVPGDVVDATIDGIGRVGVRFSGGSAT